MRFFALATIITLALSACSESKTDDLATAAESASSVEKPSPTPKKFDGPFGLQQGISLEEAKSVVPGLSASPEATHIYSSKNVPVPHEAFENYALLFSTKSGLCTISAIGKDITAGSMGSEVRSAFDSLEEGISAKYGTGKKYDFATGIMDDPKYWMMALSDKNRTLAVGWEKESGATLPANIQSIYMEAVGINMSTAYIRLQYEFANRPDCDAEIKADKNKSL